MDKLDFIKNDADCTGCSACAAACPKNAISMKTDEYGAFYPVITGDCVHCNICASVCPSNNKTKFNEPEEALAAVSKLDERENSTSGGIFYTLAKTWLKKGGIVYGCAYVDMKPEHTCITDENELKRLQGSKYAQSDASKAFPEIVEHLKEGRKVLFSGTPCQVAGLKALVETKNLNADLLTTVDLVCHGTPGNEMFTSYVKHVEKTQEIEVTDWSFRDKSKGKGSSYIGRIDYKKNGQEKEMTFNSSTAVYYNLFMKGDSYRPSCYECPYAQIQRKGDLTIGDYWGIEEQEHDFWNEHKDEKGFSLILVNNKKGRHLLQCTSKDIHLQQSNVDKAKKENGQLNHPSSFSDDREAFLSTYANGGWEAVDDWYVNKVGAAKLKVHKLYDKMPAWAKKAAKKVRKK